MEFVLSVSLHAKPCCEIVSISKKYSSSIFITYKNNKVLASDVLALLSLSAREGEKISVDIIGDNARFEKESIFAEIKKII